MTRHQLLIIMTGLLTFTAAKAEDFPIQELTYDIYYKCSFIEKEAAQADVIISCYDGNFNATLDGRSIPIMGTIYCINDTIQSTFQPSGRTMQPASENVQYLSGYYRKPHPDDLTDIYSPKSYRNIDGGGYLSADAATMECVSLTADMLCMFYYAKTVDFENMTQGVAVGIPIRMSDGAERTLQVIYQGITEFNGRSAYNLIANFTYDGVLSSYPINIMIDRELKIPLDFSASIAIGHVNMQYRL